jgi:hypothetical protein
MKERIGEGVEEKEKEKRRKEDKNRDRNRSRKEGISLTELQSPFNQVQKVDKLSED